MSSSAGTEARHATEKGGRQGENATGSEPNINPKAHSKINEKKAKKKKVWYTFNDDEISYLKAGLPAYNALLTTLQADAQGERGLKGKKGRKKDWIHKNIAPKFIDKFSLDAADGPPLAVVRDKWYYNNGTKKPAKTGAHVESLAGAKKPKVSNAKDLFAAENPEMVKGRMYIKHQEDGSKRPIGYYHSARQEAYDELDSEKRKMYEEKAAEKNRNAHAPPTADEIFENQQNIGGKTLEALSELIGFKRGQCGDVVYFVQGAYLSKNDKWMTFSNTICPKGIKVKQDFRKHLGEEAYLSTIRSPFKAFLETIPVPRKPPPTQPAVNGLMFGVDRYPLLSDIDPESMVPRELRALLREFIGAVWESCCPEEWSRLKVPWHIIDSRRHKTVLVIAGGLTPSLSTLDASSGDMSLADVFRLHGHLLQCQKNGQRGITINAKHGLFESLAGDDSDYDSDIVELPERGQKRGYTPPMLPLPKSKTVIATSPQAGGGKQVEAAPKSLPDTPPSPIDFSPDAIPAAVAALAQVHGEKPLEEDELEKFFSQPNPMTQVEQPPEDIEMSDDEVIDDLNPQKRKRSPTPDPKDSSDDDPGSRSGSSKALQDSIRGRGGARARSGGRGRGRRGRGRGRGGKVAKPSRSPTPTTPVAEVKRNLKRQREKSEEPAPPSPPRRALRSRIKPSDAEKLGTSTSLDLGTPPPGWKGFIPTDAAGNPIPYSMLGL
ncbi:hypothetical protein D9611_008445 [Ephemerocybe angulata]|uniref:Uncharacterized protein n=1 Tax=Ephemerocybe angulata TaxID=980116 RepID=A0A8H5BIN6_9AGAR|nr:hypothetical protein D9611_008445 [Tulosesus angulatus]